MLGRWVGLGAKALVEVAVGVGTQGRFELAAVDGSVTLIGGSVGVGLVGCDRKLSAVGTAGISGSHAAVDVIMKKTSTAIAACLRRSIIGRSS